MSSKIKQVMLQVVLSRTPSPPSKSNTVDSLDTS